MPRHGTTTERGYNGDHAKLKNKLRPSVAAGTAHCTELICLKPTRWINPAEPWDLAHDRRTGGYLGPAHRLCNRAEGARHGNTQRRHQPTHRTVTPTPAYQPSRHWL